MVTNEMLNEAEANLKGTSISDIREWATVAGVPNVESHGRNKKALIAAIRLQLEGNSKGPSKSAKRSKSASTNSEADTSSLDSLIQLMKRATSDVALNPYVKGQHILYRYPEEDKPRTAEIVYATFSGSERVGFVVWMDDGGFASVPETCVLGGGSAPKRRKRKKKAS